MRAAQTDELASEALKMMRRMEDYCASPEFTEPVGRFIRTHVERLEFVDLKGEQPIGCVDASTMTVCIVQVLSGSRVRVAGTTRCSARMRRWSTPFLTVRPLGTASRQSLTRELRLGFMASEKRDMKEVAAALEELKARGGASFMCADLVAAAISYEEFVYFMFDHASLLGLVEVEEGGEGSGEEVEGVEEDGAGLEGEAKCAGGREGKEADE